MNRSVSEITNEEKRAKYKKDFGRVISEIKSTAGYKKDFGRVISEIKSKPKIATYKENFGRVLSTIKGKVKSPIKIVETARIHNAKFNTDMFDLKLEPSEYFSIFDPLGWLFRK